MFRIPPSLFFAWARGCDDGGVQACFYRMVLEDGNNIDATLSFRGYYGSVGVDCVVVDSAVLYDDIFCMEQNNVVQDETYNVMQSQMRYGHFPLLARQLKADGLSLQYVSGLMDSHSKHDTFDGQSSITSI